MICLSRLILALCESFYRRRGTGRGLRASMRMKMARARRERGHLWSQRMRVWTPRSRAEPGRGRGFGAIGQDRMLAGRLPDRVGRVVARGDGAAARLVRTWGYRPGIRR